VSFGDRRQIDLDVFVVVVVDVSGLHRRRFVEVVRRRGAPSSAAAAGSVVLTAGPEE